MKQIILTLGALLCTSQAFAQAPATGFPPHGSFENERFDVRATITISSVPLNTGLTDSSFPIQ